MSADPFLIHGPAVVSFSGGRSSAMMLHRVVRAHGGRLPDDVVVAFANTGREMPATLDFVHECSVRWGAPVVWLEFNHAYKGSNSRRTRWAEVVTYETASRAGEPFSRLLESKGIVPDRTRPFCSIQLKTLTIQRHLSDTLGWSGWANVIGFRADESVRIKDKFGMEAAAFESGKSLPMKSLFPLAEAGIQKLDVLRFWRSQPFDLRLDVDGDGGNCDFCFHFPSDRLGRMFRKYPERGQAWIDDERRLGTKTYRPGQSYERVRDIALHQGTLPWDDATACMSAGCGG